MQVNSSQSRSVARALEALVVLGAISAPVAAFPAFAQSTLSPPRGDTQSPTGVSFRNGTLSLSEEDLSIGGGFPSGLDLSRIYNSGVLSPGPGANWTFSVNGYVSIEALPIYPDTDPPQAGSEPYIYTVVFGGKSVGFLGGSIFNGRTFTGGPVGTYQPAIASGAALVFNGTTGAGYYTFTDSDGTVINFTAGASGKISNWTLPDGTRLDYGYNSSNGSLQSVISNRGWALLFESNKACAVNMATTYVAATSSCPAGAQTVTYTTAAGSYNPAWPLLTSATRGGRTTSYTYNGKDHLNCIREPGQTTCKLQTTYTACADDPYLTGVQMQYHMHDYVTSQTDASGKTYAFSYHNAMETAYPVNCPQWHAETAPDYRPFNGVTTTSVENGSATTMVDASPGGSAVSVTDPLSRTVTIGLEQSPVYSIGFIPDDRISGKSAPEGNGETYTRDSRGNVTARTLTAKPGSGLPDIVSTAHYPSTCSTIKTCNEPDYVIDAGGNRTDYSYDASHGGVLTETGPADAAGIHPVKRYAYAQRYAWIRNSGGSYSQVSTPVWVRTEERYCRTSATVSGACAAGPADEVVTAYDYGPNAGPNNLLVRGIAVTADGTTRRTCYGYDTNGNRIFETKPRAGLTSCP
jgi:YD repeat-containing protein